MFPSADWPVSDVDPNLVLRITRDMPVLDPALDAAVEHHWQAACRERKLFNGRVFCADRITSAIIEGHWSEYRREIAQFADLTLRDVLAHRYLAVCGVVRCTGGVALGRRHPDAVYQPGMWQLPPAGSVDAGSAVPGGADWRHALLTELNEELGLDEACVTGLRPLCLVQHPSGVLDLGIQVDTALTAAELLQAHCASGDDEYHQMVVLPPDQVADTVSGWGGILVPPAHAFLSRLR